MTFISQYQHLQTMTDQSVIQISVFVASGDRTSRLEYYINETLELATNKSHL